MSMNLFLSKGLRAAALAIVVIVTGLTSGLAAEVSSTAQVSGVDVTVSFDKQKLHVGDTLELSIKLENVSLSDPIVDFAGSFQFPAGNGVNLQVQPPGELPYRYDGALELGNYPSTPLRLTWGKPVVIDLLLYYDRNQPSGFLFAQPGIYQLSGELEFYLRKRPEVSKVSLPTVNIEVTPATGEEAEAQKMLSGGPGLVRGLHLAVLPSKNIEKDFENIIAKHPQSTPAALALLAIGNNYGSRPDPKDREKGADLLMKYLSGGNYPVAPDSVALSLAKIYHLNKQESLAREWMFYILRNFPNSVRLDKSDPIVEYYAIEPARFASEAPWYLLSEPWKVPGVTAPTDLKVKPEE